MDTLHCTRCGVEIPTDSYPYLCAECGDEKYPLGEWKDEPRRGYVGGKIDPIFFEGGSKSYDIQSSIDACSCRMTSSAGQWSRVLNPKCPVHGRKLRLI
jgi:hypothetical protein